MRIIKLSAILVCCIFILLLPAPLLAATLQLPQTGQTVCYSATGGVVNCARTGQDGEFQMGVVWPPRFTVGPDGTVTDNLTGLIWLQDANCFDPQTLPNALRDISTVANGVCGLTDGSIPGDWRLPTVNELESLLHADQVSSAAWLNLQGFINVQDRLYWSSTSDAASFGAGWLVGMENGYVSSQNITASHYFWPVRDTVPNPPAPVWQTDGSGTSPGEAWPSPRFTDNPDGTVTDNLTGLIWLKNADCLSSTRTWQDALNSANLLSNGHCGLSDGSSPNDWRLPNRKELLSLIDRSNNAPALHASHPFTNVRNAAYWSATTLTKTPHFAWNVNLQSGEMAAADKSQGFRVWPVRDGNVRWLRVAVSGNGTVTTGPPSLDGSSTCTGPATVCNFAFPKGTIVTLTATPNNTLTRFDTWGGDCSGGAGTCQVAMTQHRSVTAEFTDRRRIIRLSGDLNFGQVNVGGTATRELTIHNDGSDILTITGITVPAPFSDDPAVTGALPVFISAGGTFVVQIRFAPGAAGPFVETITVNSNHTSGVNTRTVSGEGVDPPITGRNLIIQKSGSGTGRVFSNPPGINCDGSCETQSAVFPIGTTVTLTAIPDANSEFEGWLGIDACNDDDNVCTFLPLENNITVIAKFRALETRTVTILKTGTGDGLVFSNPSGIICGSDCVEEFALGDVITLTANPDSMSDFGGWLGVSCINAVCTFTVTDHTTITARFDRKPDIETRTVTVVKTGTGDGLVFSHPSGITCGSDCDEVFALGAVITLRAVPDAGSAFNGWLGGTCSGMIPECDFTVGANVTITASFREIPALPSYTLTVIKTGSGNGLVFSNPGGIDAGSTAADFVQGTRVTLTARPDANNSFTGWGGACTGSDSVCTLIVSQNTTVVANFEAATSYSLTILKVGSGSGLVYSNPSGVAFGIDIDCGSDCSTRFRAGTPITLTALALENSAFAGWGSGVCNGQGADCELTINDNYTIVVEFRRITAGSLITTITPWQAIDAGAQWCLDSGICYNSGAMATNLEAGTHTVTYRGVSGWRVPATQSVIIADGEARTNFGHYTRADGRLRVLLSPPEAVQAGARWRVNNSAWLNSGDEIRTAGPQQLEFSPVANWAPPAGVSLLVDNGQNLIQTFSYRTPSGTTPWGAITVHISPSGIGAQWRLTGVTGDDIWRNSGETRSHLPLASTYQITFSDLGDHWQRPRNLVTQLEGGGATAVRSFQVYYVNLKTTNCLFNWLENQFEMLFRPPFAATLSVPVEHSDLLYRCYEDTDACFGTQDARILYYGPLSDHTLLDVGSAEEWFFNSGCLP